MWWFATPALAHAACIDYALDPARLIDLEAPASRGALTEQEQSCLESAYASAGEQTTKDKVSRVLLVNAYAHDTRAWARLVARHLDEVDRSDPDIAYLYAFYLANHLNEDPSEVLRWVDVALERRDKWRGDLHVRRVLALMRLRAFSSARQWHEAAEGAGGGSDGEEFRNLTKTYAREWLDFARSAGEPYQDALELCRSAANVDSACGVEGELP